jgi:hypothetical protein
MNDENPTPGNEIIQFIGVSDLDNLERDAVEGLTSEYHEKIKRELHNNVSMAVHVKTASKHEHNEATRKRYTVKVRVDYPGQIIEGHVDDEWELPAAMHKVMTDVYNQVRNRHHTDKSRPDHPHNKDVAAKESGQTL